MEEKGRRGRDPILTVSRSTVDRGRVAVQDGKQREDLGTRQQKEVLGKEEKEEGTTALQPLMKEILMMRSHWCLSKTFLRHQLRQSSRRRVCPELEISRKRHKSNKRHGAGRRQPLFMK